MNPLDRLNGMNIKDVTEELLRCCGSKRWAQQMVRARPFKGKIRILGAADQSFKGLGREDWLEAFAQLPRLGDTVQLQERFASTTAWVEQEQKGIMGADAGLLDRLATGNLAYEKKFGFIFVMSSIGKTAADILTSLDSRIAHEPDKELRISADEVEKIARLRLEKLLEPTRY